MNSVLLCAFTGMDAELSGSVLVARDHAPNLFDPLAISRNLHAGFAGEEALGQLDGARIGADFPGHFGKPDRV